MNTGKRVSEEKSEVKLLRVAQLVENLSLLLNVQQNGDTLLFTSEDFVQVFKILLDPYSSVN